MLNKMTLQNKLILGGIVAVFIPLLIIGITIYLQISDSLLKNYRQNSIQITKDISALIDTYIEEELKLIKAVSADYDYIEAAKTGDYSKATLELKAIHDKLFDESNAIFVADRNGIIQAVSAREEQLGVNVFDRSYFQKAISGDANISEVLIARGPESSPWKGRIIFITCAPLRENEIFLGVAALVMDIDYIREKIGSIKIGETGYPFIIDKNGVIIVHPVKEMIFVTNIFEESGMEKLSLEISEQDTGTEEYKYNDTEQIASFTPVPSTGWTIVYTQEKEEIIRPLNSVLYILFYSGMIYLALTLLFTIVFSRKISSPIQKILVLFKSVIVHTENIIINIGLDRKIIFANPAVEKIMGVSQDEIIGTEPVLLNRQNSATDEIWAKLKKGISWSGRIILKNKDSQDFTFAVLIIPIKDINGIIKSYLEIGKNITNEILLEDRLEKSQKLELLGSIAGGIAHDFNNLLAAIYGYAELSLFIKENPEKTKKYIQEILKASDTARDLINQILTFSRKNVIEPEPVVLKYIIEEAVKLIRVTIPATINIQFGLNSDSVIMCEPTQIHQLIVNLCSNAAYAMKNQSGDINIILEDKFVDEKTAINIPDMEPGKYVLLCISDTGAGIEREKLDKIFDPFFTTKPKGEGTGLGLSVVHGIVRKLNGFITVNSELGNGTEFRIFLPVVDIEKSEIETTAAVITEGTERILLIDDDINIAGITENILLKLNYKVTAFSNSIEAFECFKDNPDSYDMIITDYSMPDMNGLQIIEKIRKIKKNIPVILTSGFINIDIEEKSRNLGVFTLLSKPVSIYKLADAIRKALEL